MNLFEDWKAIWTVGLIVSCAAPLIMNALDNLFFNKDQNNKYFLVTVGYIAFSVIFIPFAVSLNYLELIRYVYYLITGVIVGGAIGITLNRIEQKSKRK